MIVAGGMLAVAAPVEVRAQAPQSAQENYVDLRTGLYQGTGVLDEIPHALPGLIAGACAAILLAGFFGFYEMSGLTTLALMAVIGTILYGFYWHHP